jgi:Tol biopolymer transport system component
MAGRTLHLPALLGTLPAAVLLACAVALLVVSRQSEVTFPGKNGRITYESNGVIYTINPDGSGKVKVTNTSTAGYSIDYSPTGKKITYTDYEGHGTTAEIYTLNVGRGGKFKVTNNNRDEQDSSYSPDGKRIAYIGFDGHDYEIYTIGVHGKNRVQLTHNDKDDYGPVYSPNGKKIAASDGNGKAAEIYTTSVRGGR